MKQLASRQEIIDTYDNYKAGKIPKNDYVLFLLDFLENYIKQRINVKHRTMGAEYEDLMQQGRLAVINYADEYDPRRSMPSSYFTTYIDQYMKEILNNGGVPKHYVAAAAKLNKVAREYGFESCTTDPRLTPDTLAVLANMSLMTVLETLKYMKKTVVSLDSTSDNIEVEDSVFKNPVNKLLDQERNEFVKRQISRCTPLELYLLTNLILTEKPKSYRTLVIELKKPEFKELYKDELPETIDQVNLERIVNNIIRRIQHNPNTKKYVPEAVNAYDEVPEFDKQACESDIEKSIMLEVKQETVDLSSLK